MESHVSRAEKGQASVGALSARVQIEQN